MSVTGGRRSVRPGWVSICLSRVGGSRSVQGWESVRHVWEEVRGRGYHESPRMAPPHPTEGGGGGGGRTPGAAARPSGTPSPSLPPSPFPPGVGRPRTREAEEVGAVAIGPQRLYQPAALRALPGAVHPLQHNQRATPARHSARRRSPPAPSAAAVRPIPATVVVPAPPPPAPRCARRRKGTETPRSSRKAGRLRGAKERLRPPPALPLMNMQRERPRRPMSAGRAMNMG